MAGSRPLRILVTGASGCAGSHLSELALARGASVFGFADRNHFAAGVVGRLGDISEREQIADWLAECRPDRDFHLAALVHGAGDHPPDALLRVNIEGTQHLLDAVRRTAPVARVLVASSSGVYGNPLDPRRPIAEKAAFQPRTIYALSKAAQDLMAWQFFRANGLHIVRSRTFNQTGPRELDGLVCATLARQLARIEAGLQESVLRVHTLRTRRDFCDVRDVVAGYWAALEHGTPGEAYNVCSGRSHSIRRVVEILLAHGKAKGVRIEETLPHPGPQAILAQVGDPSRLKACSGWEARIPLEQSLRDLLDEWRLKVRSRP